MKRLTAIPAASILFCIQVSAQVGQPKALMSELLPARPIVNYIPLPIPDMEAVLREDSMESTGKDVAPRFGIPFSLGADLVKSGKVEILPNGDRIYFLGITGRGAKSLNLIFSEYHIPGGAWMHIYDPSRKCILGAFTSENESAEYNFATTLVRDDSIILEVFVPAGKYGLRLVIDKAVFGYRDADRPGVFGDAGNCNINVACPEGSAWQQQSRSVALIVTGGANNRICTGSLVNNTLENGKPYFLTAHHCPVSASNVAVFNYQSAMCSPNTDSTFAHAINGLSIKARNAKSDFLLAELSSPPPTSYRAYYAGWNASGDVAGSTACIHHPQGDVKKISLDFKLPVSSSYYNRGGDHWMIRYWDRGTTEVVSSGSPLFDDYKLIVGQLHGGDASCIANQEEDYFGKFELSFDYASDSFAQARYWLDPSGTGAEMLHGFDPLVSKKNYDLAFLGFEGLNGEVCGSDSLSPAAVIVNRGTQSVNGFYLQYSLNNIAVLTDTVNSPLAAGSSLAHTSPYIKAEGGFYLLRCEVFPIGQIDGDQGNNAGQRTVNFIPQSIPVELVLKTDDDGSETSWELISAAGMPIASGGGYQSIAGGQVIRDTFCLYDGCFNFSIYDEYGDGICCGFGQGYYHLINLQNGDTLVSNLAFSGSDSLHYFCLGDSCRISARAGISPASSVSSADGAIELEIMSGNPPFTFDWSNGMTSQEVSGLLPGIYGVRITDALSCSDSLVYSVGIGTGEDAAIIRAGENVLALYPNPANSLVRLAGFPGNSVYRLKAFNYSGSMAGEWLIGDNAESAEIDVSGLESGLYVFLLEGPSFRASGKLAVIR